MDINRRFLPVADSKEKRHGVGKVTRMPARDGLTLTGELAQVSGVYQAEHKEHGIQVEFFVRKGTRFPACSRCDKPFHFQLVRKLDYIAEDPDFK